MEQIVRGKELPRYPLLSHMSSETLSLEVERPLKGWDADIMLQELESELAYKNKLRLFLEFEAIEGE